MSAANDGGPAFPAQDWQAKGNHHPGMSLRDWFAGQETLADFDNPDATMPRGMAEALAGRPRPDHGAGNTRDQWLAMLQWDADWRARLKFIRADAMLRAREGGGK